MVRIDTHQHYWKLSEVDYPWLIPDYGPIYDTFTPEQLAPQLKAAGVDKTVVVQSANSYEDTASMLVKADYNDWIAAVVGWVNLLDPEEANKRLEMYTTAWVWAGWIANNDAATSATRVANPSTTRSLPTARISPNTRTKLSRWRARFTTRKPVGEGHSA